MSTPSPAVERARNQGGRAALLISLDFEMYWGVHDLYPVEACSAYLGRTRSTVTRLLKLFREHEIHATWAAVGFLFHRDRESLLAGLPEILPRYAKQRFSPYPGLAEIGADEAEDLYRYGASMLEEVQATAFQEIGSHTFSHCYCAEEGLTEAAFRSDLEAAVRAARAWNVELKSMVFPRNQVNPEFLGTVRQAGVACYRDNPKHWMYRERKRSEESLFRRAMRLLDHYVNLSGHHTFSLADVHPELPVALPASRLLRSYCAPLGVLEPLRIARIRAGLQHAAERGEVFHLWLHPEEMAMSPEENLAAFAKVLEYFSTLRESRGMESVNMGELAERVVAGVGENARSLALAGF